MILDTCVMKESNISNHSFDEVYGGSLCGFLKTCVSMKSTECGSCVLYQKEDSEYINKLNSEMDKKHILEEIKIKLLLGG